MLLKTAPVAFSADARAKRTAACSLRHRRVNVSNNRRSLAFRSSSTDQATGAPVSSEVLSVWLPASSLFQSVCLEVLPLGDGQAIAVTDVEEDSIPQKVGITPGQAIVGISDAIRDDTVWPVTSKPSLKFLKQILKMRLKGDVQLQLQWHEELQKQADALAAGEAPQPAAAAATAPSPPQQQQQQPRQQEDASSPSKSAMSTLDTMLGDATSDDESVGPEPQTVGDAMAAKYSQDAQASGTTKRPVDVMDPQEVRQRRKKRAAYLSEVNQRNDAPLLIGLLLAFVGPAAIILAVAYSTGYLDSLVQNSITLR